MAYERDWQFTVNHDFSPSDTFNQTRHTLWMMKALMTGQTGSLTGSGVWTIVSSSNGLTTGSGDLWGTNFTASNINFLTQSAGVNVSCSWMTLQSPAMTITGSATGTFQMLIGFSSSLGAANAARSGTATFEWSKQGFTGGTTGALPTAVDSVGNRFDGGYTGGTPQLDQFQVYDTTFGAGNRYHFGLATDGSFWFLRSRNGTGRANLGLIFTTLGERYNSDTWPVFICLNQNYSSNIVFAANGPFSQTPNNVFGPPARAANGAFGGASGPGANNIIDFTVLTSNIMGTTNSDLTDAFDGSKWNFPLYVMFSYFPAGVQLYGVRGRVKDFGVANAGSPDNTSTPASGPVMQIKIGALWLPCSTGLSL